MVVVAGVNGTSAELVFSISASSEGEQRGVVKYLQATRVPRSGEGRKVAKY